MILNSDELLSLVRLPSPAIRSPKLRRQTTRTKRAPAQLARAKGLALGENTHGGRTSVVRLSWEERVRHLHILGASGTGKSTLLFNMIRKGIEDGEGLALLDPHGDLVDRILGVIPEHRIKDVILIDPSDEEYAIGFNVLSAHSEIEKTLLASDLVSVFERLSTSWGDQMGSVLRNAILAFLESPQGGTLSDMRRFLLEPGFRTEFLKTVEDPDIAYYWQKTFGNLTGGKSVGPVLTRLDTFLAPRPIRYMVSQRENRIDFARIMDGGKILLAKLSQGAIGKENSYLLGTLLVSKFQQTAMSRQRQGAEDRRPFSLYIDEFHNFITPSMAEILSGARKYGLGLVLAHQELHQLERDRDVMSAVLSNPCVRICFRVGDRDAKTLESGFSYFEARDLQNLDTGQAIVRVERSDQDFNLTVDYHPEDDAESAATRRDEVIASSRRSYGKPRADVEKELRSGTPPPHEAEKPTASTASPSPAPPPPQVAAATATASSPAEALAAPPVPQPLAPAPPSPGPEIAPPEPEPTSVAPVPVPPSIEPVPKPPKSTKASTRGEPGKGGAQHKLLQARLKAVAESLGFSATIEKQIPSSAESVDLVFERPPVVIACEISVTTTVDHEVGNILKCLRAGFPEVFLIATTEEKLRKIEIAARTALPPEVLPRVRFFLPEQFIAYLQQLVVPPPTTSKHGNFKVKRTFVSLTPEQAKAREQAAAESPA
jgi:hypothetical protein